MTVIIMIKPTLKAKIVKIEEGTSYEEKTYDQYIFLELSNGMVIDVFDYTMLTKDNFINKIKTVTISVFLATIKKLKTPKYGVAPLSKKHYERETARGNGFTFYGQIEEIQKKNDEFVVDIGVGKIFVTPDVLTDFKIGDFLSIYSVRTDLHDIQ